MTQHTNNDYKLVSYGRKKYKVHRLVAQMFIPNPDNKPCVNHKDGDKHNNCASNLEWVTHQENINHYLETNPERNRRVKLVITNDNKEVLEFKSIHAAAQYFAVDPTTMWGASLQGNMWGMKITRIPLKEL